jgi:hypothetical protein
MAANGIFFCVQERDAQASGSLLFQTTDALLTLRAKLQPVK